MSGVLRVEDMVMTWLVNWLARWSIDVRCQDGKKRMRSRLMKFRSGMLMDYQCPSIDFRAIIFQSNHVPHTLYRAGRDDLICRRRLRPNRTAV